MLIKEFIDKFEEKVPLNLQESYDNCGLQVGNPQDIIKGIVLCLDVTEEAIDFAIQKGANLIIAHHPLIFFGLKKISYDDYFTGKIAKAIKNEITIYAAHTNIDALEGGLNQYVFRKLGFESQKKLEYLPDGRSGFGDIVQIAPIRIKDIINVIKKNLDLNHVIFYGDQEKEVKKICLLTGSGAEFIKDCIKEGVDLYITGDIKHHDVVDSINSGINILDISHHESEKYFVELLSQILEKFDMATIPTHIYQGNQRYLRQVL